MNAMVVLLPGHAQAAPETWEGSGEYCLPEGTKLPFAATQADIDSFCSRPSSEGWTEYLHRNGAQVIGRTLASTLNIHG